MRVIRRSSIDDKTTAYCNESPSGGVACRAFTSVLRVSGATASGEARRRRRTTSRAEKPDVEGHVRRLQRRRTSFRRSRGRIDWTLTPTAQRRQDGASERNPSFRLAGDEGLSDLAVLNALPHASFHA